MTEPYILADVVPSPWWYSILPLIMIGAIIVGAVMLILFGIWLGRRNTVNVKTGGVIALMLAAMLFLSGVWCMTLSPVTTYSQTKYDFYQPVSINGLETSSYSVDARQGDTLIVRVNGIRDGDSRIFSLRVFDPDNGVVWSEVNTTYAHFHSKAVKAGLHRIEVLNPGLEAVECYVQIRLSAEVTYRLLEPVGSWLILMSLPVFGLGVWASGLYEELKPYIFPPRPREASSSTLA